MMPARFQLFILAASIALLGACPPSPLRSRRRPSPPRPPNPDVTPETIDTTICVPGYTASVRPSTTYTNGVKAKLLRESAQPLVDAKLYELDHVIPLGLGGHPRNLRNLTLEVWEGEGGAKKKDRLESRLQRLVCGRYVGLRDAQAQIYGAWRAAYRVYVGD